MVRHYFREKTGKLMSVKLFASDQKKLEKLVEEGHFNSLAEGIRESINQYFSVMKV